MTSPGHSNWQTSCRAGDSARHGSESESEVGGNVESDKLVRSLLGPASMFTAESGVDELALYLFNAPSE